MREIPQNIRLNIPLVCEVINKVIIFICFFFVPNEHIFEEKKQDRNMIF